VSVKSFRENVPQKDSSPSQQAIYTSLGIGPEAASSDTRSTRSKGIFIQGQKSAKMKPIKLVALHQSIELDLPPHFSNQWRNVEWTGQNC
jgi:hypothetical protein